MTVDILYGLNAEQLEAVLHKDGPAMVLAGAGSGKTRVLTTRAAYLMQHDHVPADRILLVTFTNKAAQEMNSRVEKMNGVVLPNAGTFHRICARILRRDGHNIGIPKNFVIFDDDDQLELVKQIEATLSMSQKEYNPRMILGIISQAKNELLSPSKYSEVAKGKYQEAAARIYVKYEFELTKQHAVDFDNLLNKTVELFKKYPKVLEQYQQLFSYVLVDEYQDVNKAQYLMTKMLAAPNNNVFVVGDFSQSIYKWRGADYRNMLMFEHDFPNVKTYRLERNYRSTQDILDAASAVISNNTTHPVLSLWTDRKDAGKSITLVENESERHEANFVVQSIRTLGKTYALTDMAVLYRTNAQSRVIEDALIRAGIPYRLVGGVRFYGRKEVKDVLAYLRVVLNAEDEIAAQRIIKLGKRKAETFFTWIAQQRDRLLHLPPLEILDEILTSTQYLDRYDVHIEEDVERLENIGELKSVASEFETVESLLENVALVESDTLPDRSATGDKQDCVTLMSLHAAKGLEFAVVFMVGMEEGLFPHSRSQMNLEELEEERRLCYVGITRAKDRLFLSYARLRMFYGTISGAMVSRFIAEIPRDLLDAHQTFQDQSAHRRIVPLDDASLDKVLDGSIDIDTFLNF